MKKWILRFALVISLAFTAVSVMADPPGPPGPGGPPGSGGGVPVGSPIDGGLSFLLALGLSYGGMKLLRKKNAQDLDDNENIQ